MGKGMSWKQGLDCYTDSIKVKISEKYKPPPRINLPMTYAQRLILNKQTQDSDLYYEFGLENGVLDQIKAWRGSRLQMLQDRKLRVEKARDEIKECLQQAKQKTDNGTINTTNIESTGIPVSQPMNHHSNILTPVPLSCTKSQVTMEVKDNNINIVDFENDTYSPFDNMELKSINDIEELAQVLNYEDERNHRISNSTSYTTQLSYPTISYAGKHYTAANLSPYLDHSHLSQLNSYYPPETNHQGTLHGAIFQNINQNSVDYNNAAATSTLDAEIDSLCLSTANSTVKSPTRPKSTDMIYLNRERKETLDDGDILDSLGFQEQELCRLMSSMGFPLCRVIRVCKILGSDQKKVLEHLLVLSELIDLGFAEKDASRALMENNNDRDKALDQLVT
ncbi:unnamed protein product [Acanthoscelides obtectus]|uniref:Ubiquitin-associated protein 1 n=1 Tax=Acanthoscelides obtectus TaxID=200917 RepID=A0A9P0KF07_ACAOB|nr:unnamed protein product [Acanthoscelides obtectus]CAK1667484.1 Ubiquitin-associated protein 1 [Acanthoscelides obtectus]